MKRGAPSGTTNDDSSAMLETVARKTMEQRTGAALDDETWKRMRRKLIEFYAILRHWDKQTEGHVRWTDENN